MALAAIGETLAAPTMHAPCVSTLRREICAVIIAESLLSNVHPVPDNLAAY
jgi:hypothetical protein